MKDKLEVIKHSAIASIETTVDLKVLEELRVQYLGKKGELTAVLKNMKDLSSEERPVIGQLANEVRAEIEQSLASKKVALEAAQQDKKLQEEVVDVTMPGKKLSRGHMHPILKTLDEVKEIFLGMGYEIVEGREIETGYYNFDALNLGEEHPARDEQDTFYFNPHLLQFRCILWNLRSFLSV